MISSINQIPNPYLAEEIRLMEDKLIGKDDTLNEDGGGEIFISELNWLDLNKNEKEPVKYQ